MMLFISFSVDSINKLACLGGFANQNWQDDKISVWINCRSDCLRPCLTNKAECCNPDRVAMQKQKKAKGMKVRKGRFILATSYTLLILLLLLCLSELFLSFLLSMICLVKHSVYWCDFTEKSFKPFWEELFTHMLVDFRPFHHLYVWS